MLAEVVQVGGELCYGDGEIFKRTCGKAEENPLGKKQKTGEVRVVGVKKHVMG
jgi:hypothetical protein